MAVMERPGDGIAHFFQAQLDALERELRGPRREDRLREAVDALMRVQALFAPDADSAEGCLAGIEAEPPVVEPLRRLARELFACHRDRIGQIRAGELRRAGFVAGRAAARGEAGDRPARARGASPATSEDRG